MIVHTTGTFNVLKTPRRKPWEFYFVGKNQIYQV